MLQMYNGNPANIQADLNMALRINKGNIEALEDLLQDNLIGTIANLKLIGEGRNTGMFSTAMDSSRRFIKDLLRDKFARWNAWNFSPDPTNPVSYSLYYFNHSDRYPLRATGSSSPQSEFEESSYLHAQLCVQALAFNNQSTLRPLCEGTVLKSPFKNVTGYDISYDQRLTSHQKDTGVSDQMKKSLNHSERICAFRDFSRKNMVLFMSMNKK
jgi:hypothetical protein